MTRNWWRVAAFAALGAAAGAGCLVVAYAARPDVVLDMDRDEAAVTIGLYAVERSGDRTYAWTTDRADITLRGLSRRTPWSCTVDLQAPRPAFTDPPDLRLAVDGVVVADRRATGDPETLTVEAPARPGASGLRLTLSVSPTFVPGVGDTRKLGAQLDRLACRPGGAFAWPPRRAAEAAALAMAAFSGGLALLGLAAAPLVAGSVVLGAAQAWVITRGVGPYAAFLGDLPWLAGWIVAGMLVLRWIAGWRRGLSVTGQFAAATTAAVLFLKLLALMHPSKDPVDAVFHAHRFDAVLAGQLYFTQLSTSATPFPYAIGLYLFAAPWAMLARDHVTVLRVVVTACEATAGLLLYLAVVRAWRDRLAALLAVVLFSALPVSYVILGNANLTNAFGNAVGVAAVALATLWAGTERRWPALAGLTLVFALGLVAHVSTFVLLSATLVILAALYRWRGGQPLRNASRTVALATAAALLISIAGYWGHFAPVYREQFRRARAATITAGPARGGSPEGAGERGTAPAGLGERRLPLSERLSGAVSQTVANAGWATLVLLVIGWWRLGRDRARDRLGLALAAWGVTAAGFLSVAVLAPGNAAYQQDAWEFIGRVEQATLPAAVVLSGLGSAWMWRRKGLLRAAATLIVAGALWSGARVWASWLLAS